MTQPQFQFTIRGMLWATFWASVSMAAWVAYLRVPMIDNAHIAALFVGCVTPGAAVGPLLG